MNSWIAAKIRPIMIVSGALTCTMFYVVVAPQAALRSTFGETLEGPLAEVVVRNWGALIVLIGAMLIYAANDPPSRSVVLGAAAIGKLVFIGLVLAQGGRYLGQQAVVAVVADLAMVVLFVGYLIGARGKPQAR